MISFEGKDVRLENIAKIKALDLPIYIYGGGVYGEAILSYLNENGISKPVTYVVDDEYKQPDDGFLLFSE